MEKKLKFTIASAFSGTFVQALAINIVAVLFVPIRILYGLSYMELGIIAGSMFIVQVLADLICSIAMDKIGYKKMALPACLLASIGLVLFAIVPFITKNYFVGFLIATFFTSFSSGMVEVIVSPMAEGVPCQSNGKIMAIVHSSYAWGQVATIVVTTIILQLFGNQSWSFIVLGWAIVPMISFFMFLKCWYPPIIAKDKQLKKSDLLKNPFFILCMLALFFGGATEVLMNQWASAYLEEGIALPKIVGDLLGMCGYAIMLGIGRTLYGIKGDKVSMTKVLVISSALAFVAYIGIALSPISAINVFFACICGLFTSLLWPGTLVVANKRFPFAGAFLFGILAVCGDLGASFAPSVAGAIMDKAVTLDIVKWIADIYNISVQQGAMRFSILCASLLPLITFGVHLTIYRKTKSFNSALATKNMDIKV